MGNHLVRTLRVFGIAIKFIGGPPVSGHEIAEMILVNLVIMNHDRVPEIAVILACMGSGWLQSPNG